MSLSEDLLDSNYNLIEFRNGVIDTSSGSVIFRNKQPGDHISLVIDNDYCTNLDLDGNFRKEYIQAAHNYYSSKLDTHVFTGNGNNFYGSFAMVYK